MNFRLRPLRRTPGRAALLCAVALLQTVSMPVFSQPQGNPVFVLGKTGAAQSIKASQLTSEWRRFTPNAEQTDMLAALSRMQMTPTHFYTRGETLQSGKETYLVAYRRTPPPPTRRRGGDMDDDGDGTPNSKDEDTQRLPSNAVLTLSLLNLRVMGDLADVRAFDPARDISDPIDEKKAALAGANERSTRNLKMIGLGLQQYVQDYDELFPPMRSAQSMAEINRPQRPDKPNTVQQALRPYIRDTKIFAHPITRQLYRPNIAVSGVNQSEIEDSARTVAFWESAPAADGRRAVLYLDGHVKRELESDWPRILATSNRLLPPRNLVPRTRKGRRQIVTIRRGVSVNNSDSLPAPPPPPRPARPPR